MCPASLDLAALGEAALPLPAASAPLVVRFPALGDAVLLTVLLRALAARYGRAVHLLASGPWTPVLLGTMAAVEEIRTVRSRRSPYWLTPSRWVAVDWLQAHTGPVYWCEQDRWAERLLEQAAIPEERLVRAWRHWPGDGIHWADWWLQIARLDAPACPGPATVIDLPARPALDIPDTWHAEARSWLAEHDIADHALVLLQPGHKKTHKRGRIGTRYHDKHWPAARWATVIRGVFAVVPDAAVLVNGSPRERYLVQEIIDLVGAIPAGGRLLNLAALEPSVQRLCALAARAHSMISVDTGPAHVAGAMDCPLVVLFGAGGWGRWLPRAATSTVTAFGPEPPTPGARVMDIDPRQVIDAWAALPPRGRR